MRYDLEPPLIPEVTQPESLEWGYFAKHLGGVNPEFIGNIEFAFRIAKEGHSTLPRRDTGEENFSHPLMATIYLLQAGCTHSHHIESCLMHDLPEDNLNYLLKASSRILEAKTGLKIDREDLDINEYAGMDLIEKHFGFDTASNVSAVTKSPSIATTTAEKIEEERRYISGMILTPSSLVVKAADRLHNVRTPRSEDIPRMIRKIDETRNLYIPAFRIARGYYPKESGILIREIERTMRKQEMALAS